MSLDKQVAKIKSDCSSLIEKHGHDVSTESQLDQHFYNDLETLAKIAATDDVGDIEANGYRSAMDDIECLIKVSLKNSSFHLDIL